MMNLNLEEMKPGDMRMLTEEEIRELLAMVER